MCALCGIVGGGEHWTDGAKDFPGVEGRTRQQERQRRVRMVNKVLAHYGLSLSDWQSSTFVLKSHTGQSAIVPNLTEMWAAAQWMTKRPCDPLDPELIAALERGDTH